MSRPRFILKLSEIEFDDFRRVGGKAVNLGVLIRNGFSVPMGFVLTTNAYSSFVEENNFEDLIA
ncbi:MAG: PEP/pyruvate-binding domain-containing protein, partial [Candidatus Hodarchaeota archaeon]